MIINLKDGNQERDCYINDSIYICCHLWGFYKKLVVMMLDVS